MVFIVVVLLLLSSRLYIINKTKRDDDASFWRKLVRAISLKVVDYYCVGTPTKIVSLFLRGLFNMYSIIALSYPTIKAARQATDSRAFWSILVSWDGVSIQMTCLFVIAGTVVVLVFLILHKYETRTTKAILDTDERTKRIEEQSDKILKRLVDVDLQKIKEKMNEISTIE